MDGFAYRHESIRQPEVTIGQTLYAAPQSALISDPGDKPCGAYHDGRSPAPMGRYGDPRRELRHGGRSPFRLVTPSDRGPTFGGWEKIWRRGILLPAGTRLDPERLLIAANFGFG